MKTSITPVSFGGTGGYNHKQANCEEEQLRGPQRRQGDSLRVRYTWFQETRGHPERTTKKALPHHELKNRSRTLLSFSHLLPHYINSLSVKQCFKFMLCPQPSGYDFKTHIITLKNQTHQLVSGYYIIYHPKGFTLIQYLMDKYRRACHLAVRTLPASAPGSMSCRSSTASTTRGESCQRNPVSCPAVCARPVKLHSWLEGPADPASRHQGNGRTPTDHFIQDSSPKVHQNRHN